MYSAAYHPSRLDSNGRKSEPEFRKAINSRNIKPSPNQATNADFYSQLILFITSFCFRIVCNMGKLLVPIENAIVEQPNMFARKPNIGIS